MKALFTAFLTVSISTSLMISAVTLLRLISKKAPKALICIMWALVVVRLLLPFQIPVDFSLRPETPVITQSSTGIIEQQQVYVPEELPQFVPVQKVTDNTSAVVIDYMQIATTVWCIGLSAMLGYMLFTYMRMRYVLRESVKREEGVYENSALPTAFLLGYLRPRIYLPSDLTGERAELVIRHERAHLHRGDHWLKLMAYICLAVHWYNPLVWVMYLLLCRDIEGACDEYVIRDLDEQGRSDYSAALLSCGRGKPSFAGCPVAFGEVSIGQRIRNVLNYKKPTLWVCIALAVVIVFAAIFFLTDPAKPVPLHHNTLNGLIGQPIGAVCDQLGVKQEDLIPVDYARDKIASNTRYKLPFEAEYLGMDFEISLSPNYNAGALDGTLYAFGYYATYPSEKRSDAVASAINAASALVAMYGTPDMESFSRLGDVTYSNVTKGKLENLFEQYPDRAGMGLIWDLTDSAPSNISDYLTKFRDTERWRLNAKPDANPQYYLQMDITQDIVSQEFKIRIICTVGTLPAD